MKVDLKDIEFEEAYVVESIKTGKRPSIFSRKDKEIDSLKYETEDTDYMIQMKIKLYNQRIRKEESIKIAMINTERANLSKIGVYTLMIIIFSLIVFMIEKGAKLTSYTNINDISVMDLRSVGALFMYPVTILFIFGIIVSLAWIIVLLKRSAITEDPHDNIKRRRETIIKTCDERIDDYKKEVYRLQMKLLHLK